MGVLHGFSDLREHVEDLVELRPLLDGPAVEGQRAVVGAPLVEHDDVSVISFTGGTATGAAIAAQTASASTRTTSSTSLRMKRTSRRVPLGVAWPVVSATQTRFAPASMAVV